MKTTKRLIIASLILCIIGCDTKHPSEIDSLPLSDANSIVVDTLSIEDTIKALAVAFAIQESRLNHKAVSPCGKYVGCLQISRICVAEANRILGGHVFFDGSDGYIDDRLDRQGSYAIFKIVQTHHNPKLDIDRAITIWNKNCPKSYRDNVREFYIMALNDEQMRQYFD